MVAATDIRKYIDRLCSTFTTLCYSMSLCVSLGIDFWQFDESFCSDRHFVAGVRGISFSYLMGLSLNSVVKHVM